MRLAPASSRVPKGTAQERARLPYWIKMTSQLLLLFLLLLLVFAEAKKGASNRVPLGQVRRGNIEKAANVRLAGPTDSKISEFVAARDEVKRKLELREKQAAAKLVAEKAKKERQAAITRKIKSSSLLYRSILATRRIYEVKGDFRLDGDEEEEEEE